MFSSLIPRFKYNFNFSDLVYAFSHVQKRLSADVLKTYFNSDNIYFTNYARTALFILLNSIAKGKVLNVGVQSFTCHTVFESIHEAGCRPIFVDINNNFSLDLVSLKQNIENIDLLIITHTFGIPADINEIKQIASNKIIIEDCAHSLFSEYNGRKTGTFCDASIFSFGYGKYPSIGPGGFTIINNKNLICDFEKYYQELPSVKILNEYKNIIRNYLYAKAFNKKIYGFFTYPIGKKLDKKHDFVGKFIQIKTKGFTSNINIFIKNFLNYLNNNDLQRQIGKSLSLQLQDFINIPAEQGRYSNYYIFPLLHEERDSIIKSLFKNGIESGKHFSKSIDWIKKYGYKEGSCPNSEETVKKIFTVPSYYSLKRKEIDRTVKILRQIIK